MSVPCNISVLVFHKEKPVCLFLVTAHSMLVTRVRYHAIDNVCVQTASLLGYGAVLIGKQLLPPCTGCLVHNDSFWTRSY
jgi:hypothetical protein